MSKTEIPCEEAARLTASSERRRTRILAVIAGGLALLCAARIVQGAQARQTRAMVTGAVLQSLRQALQLSADYAPPDTLLTVHGAKGPTKVPSYFNSVSSSGSLQNMDNLYNYFYYFLDQKSGLPLYRVTNLATFPLLTEFRFEVTVQYGLPFGQSDQTTVDTILPIPRE